MSERKSKAVLLAMVTGWYVSIGFQLSEYRHQRSLADCPGHRTAWQAYPVVVTTFSVALWPIAGIIEPMIWATDRAFGKNRVCERFDAR